MHIRLLGLLVACVLVATPEATFGEEQAAPQVLWDQMDNGSEIYVASNHFPPPGLYNTSGADDFVVPTGETWTIQGVSIRAGWYPYVWERVRYFDDAGGKPGVLIATYPYRRGKTVGKLLNIWLGSDGPVLTAGTYWLAVQGNGDFRNATFAWMTRTVQSNNPAVWQNPSDSYGTGCTTWAPMAGCADVPNPDLMFAIGGVKS